MDSVSVLLDDLKNGSVKALARAITIVENELDGSELLLTSLRFSKKVPIIGITGPPGAGKSTLVNSLIKRILYLNKRVGVIAVDPTSPFNYGSLLGDRIRMSEHFLDNRVFIRSIATRGSLGGLSAKIIEITDVMRCFDFDFILVETVGVGQSEIEIVGLADTTVLVLIPEAGDEVQTIKSGIMEIADIFVVNKADREGADLFVASLIKMIHEKTQQGWMPPVIKAIATKDEGIEELYTKIVEHAAFSSTNKKNYLLVEKAYKMIQSKRMKGIEKEDLKQAIEKAINSSDFNLYQFVKNYF